MSLVDLAIYSMERAHSIEEVCALVSERTLAHQTTILLAGGTDWVVEQELRPPLGPTEEGPLILDVSRLEALRGIALSGDVLRIGAATTYLEMRRDPRVRSRAPLLERMANDVGAIQIQARGTLGGNLATGSPAADGVCALAAYDATIVVRSARGERKIPFSELQTGYKKSTRADDEVIIAVEIVLPPPGSPWVWRKVGARRAQAISKVALAGIATLEGDRLTRFGVGMASVGPVTARLPTVRALVSGAALGSISSEALDRAIEADVTPIDDVRSTRAYRHHVARALVKNFLLGMTDLARPGKPL